MKFLIQWEGQPTARHAAIERFMKTGGRPPQNITLLGHWHAVGELMLQRSDLLSMSATPVATDEELGATLAAYQRNQSEQTQANRISSSPLAGVGCGL